MRLTLSNFGWLLLLLCVSGGCLSPMQMRDSVKPASSGQDPLGRGYRDASLEPPAAKAEAKPQVQQASTTAPLPGEGLSSEQYAKWEKIIASADEAHRPQLEYLFAAVQEKAKRDLKTAAPTNDPVDPNPTSPIDISESKTKPPAEKKTADAKDQPAAKESKEEKPAAKAQQPSTSEAEPEKPKTTARKEPASESKPAAQVPSSPSPGASDQQDLASIQALPPVLPENGSSVPAGATSIPSQLPADEASYSHIAQTSLTASLHAEPGASQAPLPNYPTTSLATPAYPSTASGDPAGLQAAHQYPTTGNAAGNPAAPGTMHASAAARPLQNNTFSPDDWRAHLHASVAQLTRQAADPTLDKVTHDRLEVQLRMLQLLAGERDAAFQPIAKLDPVEQQFWAEQLYGIDALLNPNASPVPDHRALNALRHLRSSVDHLSETSSLEVRNLAFCTRVDSYGQYQRFEQYEFRPDQEVLLYVEVDNFSAKQEQHGAGFETALQGGYQIYDAAGRRVADHQFAVDREKCANRRRDFFIPFQFHLPAGIGHGRYTLKLTMEDKHAAKFGQSAISFTIVEYALNTR
ncbi:hypothetical protein [Lignipirellula cremea]|uniref:Uncharacterized protein n=1 Tax=Lignipirellula cremea TaxID=2528010 RepID=A0A518DU65_9BACT|nr:hypothetical protein [Lignipirellula cremea]QDU95377.1 hypothetical protein Pla8534_31920 [Lignipirellula cremea]